MFRPASSNVSSILLVDDNIENIKILREAVRGLGEVLFATSGQAAVEIVRERSPNVVLLDIEMPGMDGYAVCREIKSDPLICDIPVIFVTSHDHVLHEIQALSKGGVDFLHKPLNIPVARARIQVQLELQRKSRELILAQHDLADLVGHLPAFVAYWDENLNNRFCNDVTGRWFGMTSAAMQTRNIREVCGPVNYFAIDKQVRKVLEGGAASFDLTVMRDSGEPLYGQAAMVCRQLDGKTNGFLLLITDVSERKRAEIALFDEKERIRITLNSIGDAVIATDAQGFVTFLNPVAEEMTGWMEKEAVGLPVETVMPLLEIHLNYELRNPIRLALEESRTVGMALNCGLRRRDGQILEVEDSAAPIRDSQNQVTGAIIVFHDVSEARAMAVKMTHLANHDALTSLPNRLLLQDRAEQALQLARRNLGRVAMILLDIDNFKAINDTDGHTVGDLILQEFARRLRITLRATDTVSRQGGDEFIVLVPDLHGIEHARDVAIKLLNICSESFVVSDKRFDLSISLGISIFPEDGEELESLYRHADSAMYRAIDPAQIRLEM